MVYLLLELGADPNDRGLSESPWENTLRFFMTDTKKHDKKEIKTDFWGDGPKSAYDFKPLQLRYLQIMDILSLSGAKSRECRTTTNYLGQTGTKHSNICNVEYFLAKTFPLESAPILCGFQCAMRPRTPKRQHLDEDNECRGRCSASKRPKR
jgi:hypothetical protein